MAGQHAEYIGSGVLFIKDANSNVYEAGVLSDVTMDVTADIKELIGDKQYPILTAITARKVKLTGKFSQFSSSLIDAVLGGTAASGGRFVSTKTKTASTSTFTVVTADDGTPSGWAFVSDLGVRYNATGQPLKYNSGTLAAGEYKNTAAAYTLHGNDATAVVDVSYIWSATAGERATVSNTAVGLSTYFTLVCQFATTQASGTVMKIGYEFPAVLIPSLKMNFKNNDFATQDVEFSVFANSAGVVAYKHIG